MGAVRRRASLAVGLVTAGVLGLAFVYWDLTRVHAWGVDVDEVEWLPNEAHTITYFEDAFIRCAEFTIEREAFMRWAARQERPLRALSRNQSRQVFRPRNFLMNHDKIEEAMLSEGLTIETTERDREASRMTFQENDLFFEDQWANGGGYLMGYDESAGRGFYYYAHH